MPSPRYRRKRIAQREKTFTPLYIVKPTEEEGINLELDIYYQKKVLELQKFVCDAINIIATHDDIKDATPLLNNILYTLTDVVQYYKDIDLINESTDSITPNYIISQNFETLKTSVYCVVDNISVNVNSKIIASRMEYIRELIMLL